MTFTECICALLLPYTNIRREKISAPTGLHAAHRCSAAHDVGTESLLPQAFIWYLPCFAWRLCWASRRVKPIVRVYASLKGKKCISNNYWFPCTASRERENVTMLLQIVCSLRFLFSCTHTYFLCVTFMCVNVTVCVLDHTWIHTYFSAICICFAWGEAPLTAKLTSFKAYFIIASKITVTRLLAWRSIYLLIKRDVTQ